MRWRVNRPRREVSTLAWHDDDREKIDRKIWARLRQEVFKRDDYRCQQVLGNGICGRRGRLECDHKKAMRFGGEVYDLSNLQALCRQHHLDKSARENATELESEEREEWREFVKE